MDEGESEENRDGLMWLRKVPVSCKPQFNSTNSYLILQTKSEY